MAAFKLFVEQNIQGIELQQIGNMNEVPMSFDMPSNFTIDKKGSENIKISTTGSEKCNFTVVLCVTAEVITIYYNLRPMNLCIIKHFKHSYRYNLILKKIEKI